MCPVAGWGRPDVFGCSQSYTSCITSAGLPGLKAMRTVVKLMIESLKVLEDTTKLQKKTLLVSDWFFRGQIDPGSSAGK